MKILVDSTKGGIGKSTISREIIAAPISDNVVLVEIDENNQTQSPYKDEFLKVINIGRKEIRTKLTDILAENENVVIDVGLKNSAAAIKELIDYSIIYDIDRVVIPFRGSRSDCQNALTTYDALSEYCNDIIFVLNEYDDDEETNSDIEIQYEVFFNNVSDFIENFSSEMYTTVARDQFFVTATNKNKTIKNLAKDVDYKSAAFAAKNDGDKEKFKALMAKELEKRTAQALMKKTIIPAHNFIIKGLKV